MPASQAPTVGKVPMVGSTTATSTCSIVEPCGNRRRLPPCRSPVLRFSIPPAPDCASRHHRPRVTSSIRMKSGYAHSAHANEGGDSVSPNQTPLPDDSRLEPARIRTILCDWSLHNDLPGLIFQTVSPNGSGRRLADQVRRFCQEITTLWREQRRGSRSEPAHFQRGTKQMPPAGLPLAEAD